MEEEESTFDVAGHPVTRPEPACSRRWASGPALAAVFETPKPQTFAADLDALEAELTDPFAA